MRLDRRIVSLVLWFLVLAAAACGGDDKQPLPTPDAEVTGEVDEQDGRGEIDDDILPVDVEVVEDVEVIPDDVTDVDVPPEPELSFCVTATGGCLSEFPACLTMADDQYPAVAGLQVNINVDSAHIAQGTKVELWVDQVLVDSINKPADQFSFNQVTLSHKPEGHAIEVRVPNVINAQLSVCVETGDCGITLAPANDACLGVDADEETDGVQVEFTVTNDGTDCTEAWLEVDGAEVPAEHVTLTDGAAVIMVTLGAGAAELVCTEAEVTAHVTDPANPAREATLGPLAFLADNSLPVVTIEEPSAVSVNLLQDEDLEADGIQVTVSGTLEQVASQDVVELLVDGELVDAATAGTGEFSFVATLATAGPHDIEIRVTDCCDNQGNGTKGLIAIFAEEDLAIVAPANGTVLLAKDNGKDGTPTAYDATFTLFAPTAEVDDVLKVQCREDVPGSLFTLAGQATVSLLDDEWLYDVDVLLDTEVIDNKLLCRAQLTKGVSLVSPEISVTVGLPAPQLIITEPEDGAFVDPAFFKVAGTAVNLAGQEVTVTLAGNEELSWTTTATDIGFMLQESAAALPEGLYTLTVEALDEWGNLASEQPGSMTAVDIILDGAAPTLSFIAPTDGTVCTPPGCADTIDDDILPGQQIQVTLLVEGEPDPESVQVCLTANGVPQPPCATPAEANGQWVATFYGITLLTGANLLEAYAEDALGHVSETALASVTLNVDAPRITFMVPLKDVFTATEPLQVVFSVTSPDGQTPYEDAEVTLMVGGVDFDTLNVGAGGQYAFAVTGLTPNLATLLQGRADHASHAATGYSDLRKGTLKDLAPAIGIISPIDGKIFNKASTGCAAGVPGCSVDVLATTEYVEMGQTATLHVSCGNKGEFTKTATVNASLVTFKSVPLPDNATCMLVAEAEDLIGQVATSTAVTVIIDRTAPKVNSFVLPATALVAAKYDEDPDTEGFQFTVVVKAQGLETGTTAKLTIQPEEGASDTLTVVIPDNITDAAPKNVYFPQYTFTEGLNTLTVSVKDKAENSGSLTKDFSFFLDPTEVKFYQYEAVEYKECTTTADCGIGVCATVQAGKRCVIPWNAAKHVVTVITTPAEIFEGPANLRFCSKHGSLTSAVCNDTSEGEFRVIKTADLIGGFEGITFSKTEVEALPQGEHKVFVEAQSNESGEWISSLAAPSENDRYRVIFVDTIAPTVSDLSFPGNVAPQDEWLNAAEAVSGTTFKVDLSVTGAGNGTTTLSINNQTQPALPVPAGASAQLTQDLAFFQGSNDVCATAKDLVGNASAALCKAIKVDTVAPALSFVYPQGSAKLLAGTDDDVKVTTEPSLPVTLSVDLDGAVTESTLSANAQGNLTFADVMAQDGVYTMTAATYDAASNAKTVATTPPVITVDRTPPTVTIQAPTDGQAFAPEDDVAPGQGGFQVQAQFDTTGAVSWKIETRRCPDATYANCEAPLFKSEGNENGAHSVVVTLTKMLAAVEYRILRVTVTDANGNTALAERKFSVTQSECIVAFTNLPESLYINNELFCDPAGTDCASVDLDAEVSISGACGAADLLVFYVNDVPAAQSSDLGNGTVTFPLTLNDGDEVLLEARLMEQGVDTGFGTGALTYNVDLSDPVPVFVTPDSDPFLCNVAADENGGVDGCQFSAEVEVTGDNLAGGKLKLIRTEDGSEFVLGEQTMGAAPYSFTFANLTLPELDNQGLVLVAEDLAGNLAQVALVADADVTPPAAIALNAIDPATDINRRRPSVRLTWNAVGDDGTENGAATTYEFRYSDAPITGDADFATACDPTEIVGTGEAPAPEAPGSLESFDITGPDIRDPSEACRFVMNSQPGKEFWFAARAIDDAGNASSVAAGSIRSTDQLSLRYTKINTEGLNAPALGGFVFDLGDLNNDKMNEIAVAGDTAFSGFCIVKGHTDLEDEIVLADADTDPNVSCVQDSYVSWQGFQIAPLGDVNGDGFADIGSQVFVTPQGEYSTFYKVYLGDGAGFVEEPAAVNLKFTGKDYYVGQVQAAGNFNGDQTAGGKPLYDIAVGAPEINKVFIIPGNVVWKSAAPVTIDLLNAADLDAWNVLVIEGVGMAGQWFGDNAVNVGNILKDNGGVGTQYDDIAIAKTQGDSAVYVVKGRPITETGTATVSLNLDGTGTEDTVTTKIRPDTGLQTGSYWFGIELEGNKDLTGDGVKDVVIAHFNYSLSGESHAYVLSGAAIAANLGGLVRVQGTQSMGNGVTVGDNGLRIKGPASFFGLAGNFDNVPAGPGLSVDLVYTDFASAVELGHVYVRLNRQTYAESGNYFPAVDLVIEDPFTADNMEFGGYNLRPTGDVDGDGMPDLVVGSKTIGYCVLVY